MREELLEKFKLKLENEKQNLMQAIKHINDGGLGKSLSESIEELAAYDQHPADLGSEVFERSKDFALRDGVMIKVEAIQQALKNMKNGAYGKCEICGGTIPIERLEAVPYTTQCMDCREKVEEAAYQKNIRPVEEVSLDTPFARSFNDVTGKNEYDGEDAWQEVSKWQEHSPHSGAGSYYGGGEADEEPIGYTELVDHIPYEVGDDGVFYESSKGIDDDGGTQHDDDRT